MSAAGPDRFKEEFKYFKRKNPRPDLSGIIDFDNCSANPKVFEIASVTQKGVGNFLNQEVSTVGGCCEICHSLGLRDHQKWLVFSLHSNPGFLFVRNPFLVSGQQHWVRKSLEEYPLKPNRTNLDAHFENPGDVLSQQWEDVNKRTLLDKLRWVTLGYHHNWDTKVYSVDCCSDFPPCLSSLSCHVASVLGFFKYNPEAAIVNYYHMDSSLGGHVDYSEYDQSAPIISFSFGQSAIFLLGTQSKADKPVALFIRSGDIVIMSGECRLSYHAVPVLLNELVEDRYSPSGSDDSWSPFAKYLSSSRINFNVRQVFPR